MTNRMCIRARAASLALLVALTAGCDRPDPSAPPNAPAETPATPPPAPAAPVPPPPQPQARPTGNPLRELGNSQFRAVWIQDRGDNQDVFARGTALALMVLDSDDGRGERQLLPDVTHYAKPLITPDGSQVVFSDRRTNTVSIVNWDGTGLRQLTTGLALSTWTDRERGVAWVYVGTPVESDSYRDLRRVRADNPEVIEPVWNAGPIGEEIQISVDGKTMAGVFPWPDCGLADLEGRAVRKTEEGCWASMVPDGTGRVSCFDDSHRHLTLVDTRSGHKWEVGLVDTPGIEGYEVYHPRWTTHPRVITFTGPYREFGGFNRIRGGGRRVEVWAARLAPDMRSVEHWVQVTRNDRADFYPDVWISAGDP